MDWSYRVKMHDIAKFCASQANICSGAHCKDAPDHIEIEKRRRAEQKKKRSEGLPSQPSAQENTQQEYTRKDWKSQ